MIKSFLSCLAETKTLQATTKKNCQPADNFAKNIQNVCRMNTHMQIPTASDDFNIKCYAYYICYSFPLIYLAVKIIYMLCW